MTENNKFRDYVTSASFSLQLSRPMIAMLALIGGNHLPELRKMGIRSIEVPTMRRLEERGLLYSPDPVWPGRMELTDAGRHVLALLEIAGLVAVPEETKGVA